MELLEENTPPDSKPKPNSIDIRGSFCNISWACKRSLFDSSSSRLFTEVEKSINPPSSLAGSGGEFSLGAGGRLIFLFGACD
mmetsp:Transcript_809/g.1309  ORF Transcript_809/g.1309 Transcript_809/m.1309 type:complete len:82 (+) Transcript_809:335-580(+)